MIPKEKQVTSLEPSKRLKELEVKQDSLFAWYQSCGGVYCEYRVHQASRDAQSAHHDGYVNLPVEICAAFTDAELERKIFKIIGNRYDFTISFSLDGGVWDDETYSEMYEAQLIDWLDEVDSIMERADTGANAKAKMLIWLIENKMVGAAKEDV